METARINEMLAEQIAVIKEYALALEPKDLKLLAENLDRIEEAMTTLRDYLKYLPH